MISFKTDCFDEDAYWIQLDHKIFVKIKLEHIVFYNFEKEIQQKVQYKEVKYIMGIQSNQYIIRIAIIFDKMIKFCKIERNNLSIRITKSQNHSMNIGQFDILNKKQYIFYVYCYGKQIHYSCNLNKILMRCPQNKFLQNLRKFKLQLIEFTYFVDHFREQASFIVQIYTKVDFLREYFNLNITTANLIQNLKVKNDVVTLQNCFYDSPICVVNFNFFNTRNGVANLFKLGIEDQLKDITIIKEILFILVERDNNYEVFKINENSVEDNTPILMIQKARLQQIYFFENHLVNIQRGNIKSYYLGKL